MIEEKIIKQLLVKRQEMEESVFISPPADYVAFRQMVGRYGGLTEAIELIEDVLKGKDDL